MGKWLTFFYSVETQLKTNRQTMNLNYNYLALLCISRDSFWDRTKCSVFVTQELLSLLINHSFWLILVYHSEKSCLKMAVEGIQTRVRPTKKYKTA
jgi:hypothetical protein